MDCCFEGLMHKLFAFSSDNVEFGDFIIGDIVLPVKEACSLVLFCEDVFFSLSTFTVGIFFAALNIQGVVFIMSVLLFK